MNQSLLTSTDFKYKSCFTALDEKKYDLLGAKIKHLIRTFAVSLALQTEDKPALTFPDG